MVPTETAGEWLLTEALRNRVKKHLDGFQLRRASESTRHAAVALVLVNTGEEHLVYDIPNPGESTAALILTRRSERLQHHAGQWALPGGQVDPGESAETAALRELREEVGLTLDPRNVLGRLDDFSTRSGFTITPVVLWGGKHPQLVPNPLEVDSIHRIPVTEFLRNDAPHLDNSSAGNNPILFMPVGRGWIASPTGAILYQFREVGLLGQHVRVSHYDQPLFAWQ